MPWSLNPLYISTIVHWFHQVFITKVIEKNQVQYIDYMLVELLDLHRSSDHIWLNMKEINTEKNVNSFLDHGNS
jgi:hypothetical protein